MKQTSIQRCISCQEEYESNEVVYSCRKCGSLLEVSLPYVKELDGLTLVRRWEAREKTIWRFREVIPLDGIIVSLKEGGTPLYLAERAAKWAGVKKLYVKFEGLNPTGSFKDRGMSVGVSKALELRKRVVVCASTGNTSSSMSAYAAAAGLQAVVVVPKKGIAAGKLFQTILHGAKTVQIRESFDKALSSVLSTALGRDVYILNSINPWRIEGQKTVAYELWQE
ncbi:MAG: pyridoxal-phosphate dependent enzyme, partial [Nitrososphaerota archaeon]|nr:pyridoxal-phosphate dependent enzyme [Nitrososphaerota archaeon]